MKKNIIWILLLPIILIAANKDNDKKIEKLTQETFNIKSNLSQNNHITISGNDIVKITINNNIENGYKIYAKATNSKLTNGTNAQAINYSLTCKAFTTNNHKKGIIIPESTRIQLIANNKQLIYTVGKQESPTVMAKTTCDLIPNPNQNLNALFSGVYIDDISFSMESEGDKVIK